MMPNPIFNKRININFKTTAPITNRTVIVSEAFGLGIDEEKLFTLYDNVPLTIYDGDVVYITGDSGGGKSCLMKLLQSKLSIINPDNVASMSDLTISGDEVLVENIGKDINQALEILSLVGLGDAFIMLRQYNQLSDGQRYRYAIGKMLNSSANIWFIDEFCATLDRDTAKVISYNIQKIARRLGKTIFVATTHQDIEEDLNPSLKVKKNFGGTVEIIRRPFEKRWFSMTDQITFRLGTWKDYLDSNLGQFHYRDHNRPVGVINVFLAEVNNNTIGVLVTKYPPLELQERNYETNKRYTKHYKDLNRDVETISRVIIHPKFRGIGLGTRLVKEYLNSERSRKIVETIAVMAKFNPFFEKAGMKRIIIDRKKLTKKYEKFLSLLREFNFDLELVTSVRYNKDRLMQLDEESLSRLRDMVVDELRKVLAFYGTKKDKLASLKKVSDKINIDAVAKAIKRIKKVDKAYYIWFNPRFNEVEALTSQES